MVELTVQDVLWCAPHGHPALALATVGGESCFLVAVSVGAAQALAIAPTEGDGVTCAGVYDLVRATIDGLGGRLREVRLSLLAPGPTLGAWVCVDGARGEIVLPVPFAEGVVLALRGGVPLRMGDEEFARVRVPGTPPGDAPAPPEPFRSFVASLDLDGLGGDRPA